MLKFYILFITYLLSITLAAQESGHQGLSFENTQCLTDRQQRHIIADLQLIHEHSPQLQAYGQKRQPVRFEFPLKYADHVKDPGVIAISAFVDHGDKSSGDHNLFAVDYHCGNRSYDIENYNHTGTDYFAWPFSWALMHDDGVEAIAAAEGMIIDKADGFYDQNCGFCGSCQWNAVYIQHSDGSIAWYGHLKKGSVTTKETGDFVEVGEYLGVVGSSGNSTGPHLHFQIWESSAYQKVLDPYVGPCNSTVDESLWANQEPYYASQVSRATVGINPPYPRNCPQTDISSEKDTVIAGTEVVFTGYVRDAVEANQIDYKIINEQTQEVYANWTDHIPIFYPATWNWHRRYLGYNAAQGFYRFEVSHQQTSKSARFFIINPYHKNPNGRDATIYYDAEQKELNVLSSIDSEGINKVTIYNVQGQLISEVDFEYVHKQSFLSYPAGVYLIYVKDEKGLLGMQKILVY